MPSRNKKNKNRVQPTTSGTSAPKNGATPVKISEDSGQPSNEVEPKPDLKSKINVAKEKLEQLQQTVDSIKASISKSNAEKSDEKPSDAAAAAVAEEKPEQPFETQTMKKKRNRNRNRNRNKNLQSNTTDESGMSSTSGTNENSTHENSPTPATLTTILLPTSVVITSEIKEEPTQVVDSIELKEESDENAENAVEITEAEAVAVIQAETVSESSPKIEEIESKTIENEAKIEESSTKPVEYSTADDEKVTPIETPVKVKENEPSSLKEDEKMEQLTKDSDKRPKENEKQKKNRQPKNANKNQKEKLSADAEPKSQDENKIDSIDDLHEPEKVETKEDLPDVKKVNTEPKNKNNKTAKENKKSPKMNKKNPPSESDPVQPGEKQSVEPCEVVSLSDAGKKVDGDENVVIQKIGGPKATIIESEDPPSKVVEEPIQAEQQSQPIEQIPLPSEQIQTDSNSQELKVETKSKVESAIKQDDVVVEKQQLTIEPEIKEEIKQEINEEPKDILDQKVEKIKVETKQQSTETKSVQPPSAPPKESKKSKGKKSQPPQIKAQNEQKENNRKENIAVEEKVEPVPQKKEEIHSDLSTVVEATTAIEPPKEDTLIEPSKESPAQPEVDPVDIKATAEEKSTKDEFPNVENPKPIMNLDAPKSESAPKEQTASTSKNQPNSEVESKKSEPIVATSSEEVTKTPSSTPVLTTGPSKKPIQQEDETAKIWKILEEASKSLEPVEIEMDDPVMPTIDPPVTESTVPIVCLPKDDKKVKEELVTILETKEPIKQTKQGAQPKPSKAKENNQQPKQSSPTKTIDPQPKKAVDSKKKETKPAQKNNKPTKAAQPQTSSTPEKTPEKDKTLPIETPPIEVNNEPGAVPIEEVPLDVSIMPSEIEVAELNADSKNVQGSDFVPSVEQSAAETESLVPENDVNVEAVQSIQPRGSKSKSKSPINVKNEKAPETKSQPVVGGNVQETDPKVEISNEKSENTVTPPTEPKKSQSKSPSTSVSPEKGKQPAQNSKQKEMPIKNAQGRTSQNSRKANGKPVVPPKPDHLINSQAKKTQSVLPKSESAVKSKTEKILVLTGNIEDEDSEDDYIEYKFMPRQVFISTICQACKKPTTSSERILCQLCQMVSYCCDEHGKNDEPIHKDLCTALQEIAKKRGGHIYNNARILNNNDYRSLRVHTLNLCENFLKRPLQTYEREILLFPRLCSTPTCREWRQNLLTDCPGCGQVFFCTAQPDHLIESHQRWCKSVALYQKLVVTQSVSGRIEPSLPSRIQTKPYTLPNNVGDVFKDLYKNYSAIKDDCVFATLTQLATAPLTAYFATQKAGQQIGEKFTIHLIGAELQFEADVLDIWETFFLHLAHNLMELTIVFCGPELNAENIPLDIISRIRMCRACRQNCRIVKFDFQCAKFYHDYAKSSAYSKPDLICFFNPGFHHINSLNGLDTWSETIKIASTSGCPVVVTSYTEYESPRDLDRFQNESSNGGKQMNLIHGPEFNEYSSQRPERNFISDEIVPLIFKNYFCFIMK